MRAVSCHGQCPLLESKTRKSKTFAPNAPKPVTGTIIVGEMLRLPYARHRKIQDTRSALRMAAGAGRETSQRQLLPV